MPNGAGAAAQIQHFRGGVAGYHWAMHMAGGDAVDADVVAPVMHRHGVAQADDAAFGGSVGVAGAPAAGPQSDNGRQVDDGAAAGSNHLRDGVFGR